MQQPVDDDSHYSTGLQIDAGESSSRGASSSAQAESRDVDPLDEARARVHRVRVESSESSLGNGPNNSSSSGSSLRAGNDLMMEPPLPINSSNPSSPTRPSLPWPNSSSSSSSSSGSTQTLHPQHHLHPQPSHHHSSHPSSSLVASHTHSHSHSSGSYDPSSTSSSASMLPKSVPHKDPFDDGVHSFAEDPFAHDASDAEEAERSSGTASLSGTLKHLIEGLEPGECVEGPAATAFRESREVGGNNSSSGAGRAEGEHAGEEGQEEDDDEEDDGYGEPSRDRPQSRRSPPSPPPFVRAFSAPVHTSKLGNLVHPGRRPSQSNHRPSHLSPSSGLQRNDSDISTFSNDGPNSFRPEHQRTSSIASTSQDFHSFADSSHDSSSSLASEAISSNARRIAALSHNTQSGLYTLSLELADSVQAAIQTLLQITPPHLFDQAKEQFSACTVQMPATSLTSLLTAMKNLNYLAEHITPLCLNEKHGQTTLNVPPTHAALTRSNTADTSFASSSAASSRLPSATTSRPASFHQQLSSASAIPTFPSSEEPLSASASSSSSFANEFPSRPSLDISTQSFFTTFSSEPISLLQDFDIGEMVQSVGDLLGGLTAQSGLDMVLFHGDVGMKHFSVKGDEGGICYVLSHVIRQIILTAREGDAIEIGLHVTAQSPSCRNIDLPISELACRTRTLSLNSDPNNGGSSPSSPPGPREGPLLCSFEIIHNVATKNHLPAMTPRTERGSSKEGFPGLSPAGEEGGDEAGERKKGDDEEEESSLPALPIMDTPLTQKLLQHVSAALRSETDVTSTRRHFELSLLLERGAPLVEPALLSESEEAARQPFSHLKLAREPTLVELQAFVETLRGKKVAFHASETSAFAKHLTSYLTAWGLDMRHISTEREEEEEKDSLVGLGLPSNSGAGGPGLGLGGRGDSGYGGSEQSGGSSPLTAGMAAPTSGSVSVGPGALPTLGGGGGAPQPFEMVTSPLALRANMSIPGGLGPLPEAGLPNVGELDKDVGSFIIIDDDVNVLRRRLLQLRAQNSSSPIFRPRSVSKRPSLASRTRSTPQIRQFLPQNQNPKRGVVIIHFTSLGNYSRVRDAIQSIFTPGSATSLPEVMVIPKPIGPRRFLTALHTGVHRPIVDPFFTPIATSPLSPSGNYGSAFGYFPPSVAPASSSPLSAKEDLEAIRPSQSRTASANSVNSVGSGKVPAAGVVEGGKLHLNLPDPDVTNPIDFLADTATKFGQSARSGMLIQSPDGMPMGMFFDPAPRTPNSRRSSGATNKSKEDSERRRREGGISRPPIATFTSSIDGMMKSTGSSSSMGGASRQSTIMPSSPHREASHRPRHGGSDFDASPSTSDTNNNMLAPSGSTTKSTLRRTPSTERKTSPLDRAEGSSPLPSRGSRSRNSQTGGSISQQHQQQPSIPAVLSHRNSNASQSGGAAPARSPLREEAPSLGSREGSSSGVGGGENEAEELSPHATPQGGAGTLSPSKSAKELASPTDPSAVVASPAKTKKKATSKPKKAAKKDDGMVVPPINVLIVEDNPINQTILSTFMKKKKIKFNVANNGEEAVEKWRTGGFHLILMDIQLPVMDGIEATREIRRLERYHNIGVFPSTPTSEVVRTPSPSTEAMPTSPFRSSVIIVALTASSLQSDRVSALAAGCNDFLTKPVSLKWLEAKIVEWGCMQALIDFDGWRRWRGTDPKAEASGSSALGPSAQALTGQDAQVRALRSRMKIDRNRPPRLSPKPQAAQDLAVRQGNPLLPPPPHVPAQVPATPASEATDEQSGPSISVQIPTPLPLDDTDPVPTQPIELNAPPSTPPIKASASSDTVSQNASGEVPASLLADPVQSAAAPEELDPALAELVDRPPSPVPDNEVPASTLANVPISGSGTLTRHLEAAAEELEAEGRKEDEASFSRQIFAGRNRSSSDLPPSIDSVLSSSTSTSPSAPKKVQQPQQQHPHPTASDPNEAISSSDNDDPTPKVLISSPSPPNNARSPDEHHSRQPSDSDDTYLNSEHADAGPHPSSGSSSSGSPSSLKEGNTSSSTPDSMEEERRQRSSDEQRLDGHTPTQESEDAAAGGAVGEGR